MTDTAEFPELPNRRHPAHPSFVGQANRAFIIS
jgi:hypothetical protein